MRANEKPQVSLPWVSASHRGMVLIAAQRIMASENDGVAFVIVGQAAVSGDAPGHPKDGHGCGLRLKTT
jgi:hypothetical protein